MPKKQEIQKLNPGDCVRSLTLFHENVVGLITLINVIEDDLPEPYRTKLNEAAGKVREFYHE